MASHTLFAPHSLQLWLEAQSQDLPAVSLEQVRQLAQHTGGIHEDQALQAMLLAARSLIEQHPDYNIFCSRLLLGQLYQEVLGSLSPEGRYASGFAHYLHQGVQAGVLDPRLLTLDPEVLSQCLDPAADQLLRFQGLQIMKDRYLIRDRQQRLLELPQWLWLRVAAGLCLNEQDPLRWAPRFYKVISQLRYLPSTPTLFSAGTPHPQLSSCFLNTVEDSLEGIFKCFSDNARLSKWAGGIGTDWTPIRATGSLIQGTNGESQGLIPWLRIDNDVALAVNQGGKRKGAHCAYLETWHLDLPDFLDLRKNVGDERRRTHDLHLAHWIPDLFMQRVLADQHWTLFCPSDVPDLHDLYGAAFVQRYTAYETDFEAGRIRGQRLRAQDLWRRMLTSLFETGHPWITFKDPSNLRSPQDHAGIVRSSNLCTEITLNSSASETAVCNLGSLNLGRHIYKGVLLTACLSETIELAVRMLDNVIDLNYYPTPEASKANLQHRAVGLGVMGYQDALLALDLPFDSEAHLDWADQTFEWISYQALQASCQLAQEKGPYASFTGSKWSRGLFPMDTLTLLEASRGEALALPKGSLHGQLNWERLKQAVSQYGLRNSNLLAIAPTATISHLAHASPCIEPLFSPLYVSSNLSGEFTELAPGLVAELEAAGLWSSELLDRLKAVDGQLSRLPEIPKPIRQRYRQAFELDQRWLIRAAARRGKWLDQSQSLNLFVSQASGKLLHELYTLAWHSGLKSTYYLRTRAASQVEKAALDPNRHGRSHQRQRDTPATAPVCRPDAPDCEVCQ